MRAIALDAWLIIATLVDSPDMRSKVEQQGRVSCATEASKHLIFFNAKEPYLWWIPLEY